MEYINDDGLLRELMEQEGIPSRFETRGLPFRLIRYRRAELVCGPLDPLTYLLFVARGTIQVYQLREDGSQVLVSRGRGPAVLGTMELARRGAPTFFTEATSELLCVGLPLEENRAVLERDRTFLLYMSGVLADMVIDATLFGQAQQTVEEKVLVFLRYVQPDHTLTGIGSGVAQLHCSRRQLQRAVKGLCEDGRLRRTKKGVYVLAEAEERGKF